jgi:hypothetical protein
MSKPTILIEGSWHLSRSGWGIAQAASDNLAPFSILRSKKVSLGATTSQKGNKSIVVEKQNRRSIDIVSDVRIKKFRSTSI